MSGLKEIASNVLYSYDAAQAWVSGFGFSNRTVRQLRESKYTNTGGFIERYTSPDRQTSYVLIFVPNPYGADPQRGEDPKSYFERSGYARFVNTLDRSFSPEGFVYKSTYTEEDGSQRLAVLEHKEEIRSLIRRGVVKKTQVIQIVPVPSRMMAENFSRAIAYAKRSSTGETEQGNVFGKLFDSVRGTALTITQAKLDRLTSRLRN